MEKLPKLFSVEDVLKKYPQLKEDDIKAIQEWLKTQPHLPKITQQEIVLHLCGKKFSVEACKKVLDEFYTFRTHVNDLFESRDILGDELQFIKDVGAIIPLPKMTPDGYSIIVAKILDPDPSKYLIKSLAKLACMVNECEILENGPIKGFIVLADLSGLTLRHVPQINIKILSQLTHFIQHLFPASLKAFCLLNSNAFADHFVVMLKQLLSKKSLQKLRQYKQVKDVVELFPLELLPKDYEGGCEDSIQTLHENYIKYLTARREYFLNSVNGRFVNEKLRPESSKIEKNYLFGLEGNFKKLDFD